MNIKQKILCAVIACILGWFFLMLVFSAIANAEEVNIQVIMTIESGGNPNAYNKRSGAIGLYQITPIVLREYNYQMCDGVFTPPGYNEEQLYDPTINSIIAKWYMNKRIPILFKKFNIKDTIENRLWAYNAGIGKVKNGIMPKETRNYIKKYHKLEKLHKTEIQN